MSRTLPALAGTPYTAKVTQGPHRDFTVRVIRPANETELAMFHPALGHAPENGLEEVAARCLASTADEHTLNRVVEDIVRSQKPSIVGDYAAEPEEETE